MHWHERRRVQVALGHELEKRGWRLWGYKPDRSDSMSDYHDPATWDGVATHEKYPAVVVCVLVTEYDVRASSGQMEKRHFTVPGAACKRCSGTGIHPGGLTYEEARRNPSGQHFVTWAQEHGGRALIPEAVSPLHYHDDGRPRCLDCNGRGHALETREEDVARWPVFHATAKGWWWHVEHNGKIIARGRGMTEASHDSYSSGPQRAVVAAADAIERAVVARSPQVSQEVAVAQGDAGYQITHERDWTWIAFAAKPDEATRERLKALGARFSGRRMAWYVMQHLEAGQVQAAIG